MSNEEMEEIKRHFGVIAESLRTDIQQIAEGHDIIRRELQTQREELKEEFKETKSLMRMSYAQLDHRMDTVESDMSALESRVDRLESNQA
jgi:ubiquinone biosynthesis protein UbiJ